MIFNNYLLKQLVVGGAAITTPFEHPYYIRASTAGSSNFPLQNNTKYTFCYFNNSLFKTSIPASLF
jgi:hypothetical protein